jgi:hypothetical protein
VSYGAITIAIISSAVALLVVWDVWVAFCNDVPNENDTISGIMRRIGRRVVAIPLGLGGVCGHFWGPSIPSPLGQPESVIVAGFIVVSLTVAHFVMRRYKVWPDWTALVYLLVGIPIGAIMWPQ